MLEIATAAKCLYIATLLNNRIYLILIDPNHTGDRPMMRGENMSRWIAATLPVVAAAIIAGDPQRYPSPALQEWARLILARAQERRAAA